MYSVCEQFICVMFFLFPSLFFVGDGRRINVRINAMTKASEGHGGPFLGSVMGLSLLSVFVLCFFFACYVGRWV